jgi:hypothetical protein
VKEVSVDENRRIRTVRFNPYIRGRGPTFTLSLYEPSDAVVRKYQHRSQSPVGYKLTMREPGKTAVVLLQGDYGCSPRHEIDSDESVRGLLDFLTLRPGDTDAEYFANYSEAQLDYCNKYAATLDVEATARFGEE